MLSRLDFASCYVYSKRGQSEQALAARRIRDRVKFGAPDALAGVARRIAQLNRPGQGLSGWFPPDAILVPTPGSAPLLSGGLWVPELICRALRAEGLGADVAPIVSRRVAVPKSAFAAPGSRPSVQRHVDSLNVEDQLMPAGPLLIVDDVITKGRTLLAVASRLRQSYPEREIRGFAVIRYRGFVDEIDDRIDPCTGTITWSDGDAQREP